MAQSLLDYQNTEQFTHTHTHRRVKMADEVGLQFESALSTLLNIPEEWQPAERPQARHCGFRKYIEEHICESKKQCRRTYCANYPT